MVFGVRTRKADNLARSLIEALEEPAALYDVAGRVQIANSAWTQGPGAGGGALGGEGVFAAFRSAARDGRGRGALAGRVDAPVIEVARLDGRLFLVRLAAPVVSPPGPRAEDERVQARLAQRAKMEAVGQLAGGVAHDFNNLLTAIRLRVEELLQRHPLGDPAYDSLSEIRGTVSRAADVVRQLLTFSRKATVKREVLDLGEILIDVEVLLRRLLRETIGLETRYDRDLPLVLADRSQIETAVVNLIVNARDAIGEGGAGLVRLSARRVAPMEARDLGFAGAPCGDMALVEVSDNGPGIPAAVLPSIFDPFYTTKAPGEGTGLGLATVYGIVKQADGAIVADSPPGEGARFRIFLPSHGPPIWVEPPPAPGARAASRDVSGHGRILLVEDEVLVRGVTARILRGRGYEVLEAADGEAALEIARANDGGIDLMISDVIMPGMDGPALLEAVRPYLKGAPVAFMSGYAEAEFSDLLAGLGDVSFLPKPLDIATLAEHVKHRLDAARQAASGDA
jgi:two-component system cell cycle sensor histidine kinase/response regulator CckA